MWSSFHFSAEHVLREKKESTSAMRYYLKKLYPCDSISHMMTMTQPQLQSQETNEDAEEMQVEPSPIVAKFYRQLGFSANDKFWRDKQRCVTSHRAFVHELWERAPDQVHFGALQLYDERGQETTCHQELVFDIDVTDFTQYCACGAVCANGGDCRSKAGGNACVACECTSGQRHTRYCQCDGASKACTTCWLHIEGAAELLHFLLVRQLGIAERNLLWVFSGKKGIHCLVNDRLYTAMTLQHRTALYQLLQRGDSAARLKEFGAAVWASDNDAAQRWEELFVENVVCRRHMLLNDVFVRDCLELVRVHYPALHHQLEQRWSSSSGTGSSLSRWQTLKLLEYGQFVEGCPPSLLLVLHYYYPRIDRGPLCTRNHLIKLPFSVHKSKPHNIALPLERRHVVERHGLPALSLTLDAALQYYHATGRTQKTPHPDFVLGCQLLSSWLAAR
jgi:hypothetical protein